MSYLDSDERLNKRAREAMDVIEKARLRQIHRELEPIALEAREKGCGFRLVTVGGWFSSAEVAEHLAPNVCEYRDMALTQRWE